MPDFQGPAGAPSDSQTAPAAAVDKSLASVMRSERQRGARLPKRATAGPAVGSRGPDHQRRMELATARAARLAPSMGVGPAISRAIFENGIPTGSPRHFAEIVSTMTVDVRGRLKIPDPDVPARRPRMPQPRRTSSDSQTKVMALIRCLAVARGHGPALANMERILTTR